MFWVDPAVASLLANYRERLTALLGERLMDVRLFGSYARGDANADSDIDVAVVVDEIRCHSDRTAPLELAAELSLAAGLLLSPLVLSAPELAQLKAREALLAQNLEREGIAL